MIGQLWSRGRCAACALQAAVGFKSLGGGRSGARCQVGGLPARRIRPQSTAPMAKIALDHQKATV